MTLLGRPTALLCQRHFPPVKVTGRCFLLRPRSSSTTPLSTGASGASTGARPDLECIELTQGRSGAPLAQRERALPSSLVGNSYYTQRYKARGSAGHRAGDSPAGPSSLRFFSGDVVLRLRRSAVPRELAHKRVVDVTGMQTSFFNSSEHSRSALATVEETLATMHLHDGHEVPALQRGDVDLVRLQPQCVYAPPSTSSFSQKEPDARRSLSAAEFDLTNLESVLFPLDNPNLLLAQSRRLTFRSEMDALQVARVMAAAVSALKVGQKSKEFRAAPGALLRPVIRDGHLISVVLRMPRPPQLNNRCF